MSVHVANIVPVTRGSQRASDVRHYMSAARVWLLNHGWTPVRVDRFENGTGDFVEMGYVYGEVRLAYYSHAGGVLDFRLFGPTSREDEDKFEAFKLLTQ